MSKILDRIIRSNRASAEAIVALHDRFGLRATKMLYRDLQIADRHLLERITANANGDGSVRFTEAQARTMRLQVQNILAQVQARLGTRISETQRNAAVQAAEANMHQIEQFDKAFGGMVRPINLRPAMALARIEENVQGALVTRKANSVARYGEAMAGKFEAAVRRGLAFGYSHDQMVADVYNECGFFPNRYWAERIVRTETAYAYNAATMETIHEAGMEHKKILATMDNRVAFDSLAVHGQVKKVDQMFVDGAGREYLHPPARPNDRETVVAWDKDWGETPSSQPLTAEQIATRTRETEAHQERAGRTRRAYLRNQDEQATPRAARKAEKRAEQQATPAERAEFARPLAEDQPVPLRAASPVPSGSPINRPLGNIFTAGPAANTAPAPTPPVARAPRVKRAALVEQQVTQWMQNQPTRKGAGGLHGHGFGQATTREVAKAMGWDEYKAYRVLARMAKEGKIYGSTATASIQLRTWEMHFKPDNS